MEVACGYQKYSADTALNDAQFSCRFHVTQIRDVAHLSGHLVEAEDVKNGARWNVV